MGDNLPAVDLGTGRTAVKAVAGDDFTCVLLDNTDVVCFGANDEGQLGIGDDVGMICFGVVFGLGFGIWGFRVLVLVWILILFFAFCFCF